MSSSRAEDGPVFDRVLLWIRIEAQDAIQFVDLAGRTSGPGTTGRTRPSPFAPAGRQGEDRRGMRGESCGWIYSALVAGLAASVTSEYKTA